jgi:hydroxyacylglutathione hydrolase
MMSQANPAPAPNGAHPPTGPKLRARTFTLGPYQTNCYLLWCDGSPDAWIIDASFGLDAPASGRPRGGPIAIAVAELALTPTWLVLTHTHIDHIAGVDHLRAAYPDLKVAVHRDEVHWLHDPLKNLSALSGTPVTALGGREPDRVLNDADELALGATSWRVLHTPGHSPGGISLYCAQAALLIAGDALFNGSIGRTDFPGADHDTLLKSIRTKLYTLPGETQVLAGHGPPTTVARERASNPFVRG